MDIGGASADLAKEPTKRKSSSDIFRDMTVSKACAILRITEKEYRELTDAGLRKAFSRRVSVDTSAADEGKKTSRFQVRILILIPIYITTHMS